VRIFIAGKDYTLKKLNYLQIKKTALKSKDKSKEL
jgi:hypothetical protein